jgi:hypothetical protein
MPASEQERGAEVSRSPGSQLVGRTPQDMIVILDAPPAYIGALVKVYVESASAQTLFGRITGVASPARSALNGGGSAPGIRPLPLMPTPVAV